MPTTGYARLLGTMPDYLTVEETAKVLRYSPQYIRRMLRQGKLRGDKKGTMWLVYRQAVEEYAEAVKGKAKHDPTRGV